jgi:hypothetical protein
LRKLPVFLSAILLTGLAIPSKAFCFSDAQNDAAVAPALVFDAPSSPATPKSNRSSGDGFSVGAGAKVSTLGAGAEVAFPLAHRFNARAGFNLFNYDRTFNKDGVAYKGTLNLRSVPALLDFFPFGGGFHLSPGLLVYNGNRVNANASVPGGQSFTLGGTTYFSDATQPVSGTGKLSLNAAAPMFLFGWGNLVPRSRRRFSVSIEAGAAYQGSPSIKLNLSGSVCDDAIGTNCRAISGDPTVESQIVTEQNKLNHDASPYKFYPVISFGIGYKF